MYPPETQGRYRNEDSKPPFVTQRKNGSLIAPLITKSGAYNEYLTPDQYVLRTAFS